uniref:Prephenate dehydrogenase n=1 Tax=Candidatus Kentrum sp. UNK TaxID=2126344 RepID=A0A451A6C7_9GAMM|nr:MAG: Prephenate dehydrogenase [Candidatus Kentron sp. UNK]VFK70469.1 MAG: Prephenate dehydrogenase [Candidatus Kentron sp. UNK]
MYLRKMDGEGGILRCTAGFRDFSRLAASDPQMWADIRLANADAIIPLLEDFDSQLKSITHAIRGGEGESLKAFFARAVEYRGRQYG